MSKIEKAWTKRELIDYLEDMAVPDDTPVMVSFWSMIEQGVDIVEALVAAPLNKASINGNARVRGTGSDYGFMQVMTHRSQWPSKRPKSDDIEVMLIGAYN